MTFVVAFFVALYSLGRHATGIEAWLGVLGLVVTMAIFVNSEGGLAQADLGDFAFVLVFVGAPWAAGLTLRLRRERETELNAENDRLRREQEEQAARAVAEERSRIARELHDVVSHAISVTVLQARGARATLDADPDGRPPRAGRDRADQHRGARRHAPAAGGAPRHRARRVDHRRPRPAAVAGPPRPAWSSTSASSGRPGRGRACVGDAAGPAAGRRPVGVPDRPGGADQRAQARRPTRGPGSCSSTAPDALDVTVTDDGIAGPVDGTEPGGGHGLIGIRERVAVVGGEVEAGPRPDGGYEIRARLPYALEVS